jgi:alpha-acetolactate decarboxylase
MHLHFITDDGKLAGHVDDITVKANITLFLPEL